MTLVTIGIELNLSDSETVTSYIDAGGATSLRTYIPIGATASTSSYSTHRAGEFDEFDVHVQCLVSITVHRREPILLLAEKTLGELK